MMVGFELKPLYGGIQDYFDQKKGKQEPEEVGIGGFTALAFVEKTLNLKSEAPVHYLEDGAAVQEHIILKPKSVKITGEVGDVWIRPDAFKALQASLTSNIGKITSYLPAQAQAMQQKAAALVNDFTDKIRQIDGYINDGKQIFSFLGNKADPAPQSTQELFLAFIVQLRDSRQLFKIDMFYEAYENMYMESLVVTENNQSKALKFDITATQIRIAESVVTDAANPSDEAKKQVGEKKKATATPKKEDESIARQGLTKLKSFFGH